MANKYIYSESKGLSLYSNLIDADGAILYHEKHENILAHPADIFRDKINALASRFKSLTEITEPNPFEEKNIKHTKDFILGMDEFYDSLILVIKCFTKPTQPDNKDVPSWLKSQKSPIYTTFAGATKRDHDIFRKMANKIKHDHVSIGFTKLRNHNRREVYGFYVERAIGVDGLRGPDPEIHKKYKQTIHTAFSYNHFILYSVGCIFHYIHWLNKSIFDKKSQNHHPFSPLSSILSLANNTEIQFFPDEFVRPFSKIEHHNEEYKIEYPYRYPKKLREDFDEIKSYSSPLLFNQRTNRSHSALPYMQLIYKQGKAD